MYIYIYIYIYVRGADRGPALSLGRVSRGNQRVIMIIIQIIQTIIIMMLVLVTIVHRNTFT